MDVQALDWNDDYCAETGPSSSCPMCGAPATAWHTDFRGPYPDTLHRQCTECGFHTQEPPQ